MDLVAQGREWGEERVYYRDENGRLRFLPARWTNLAALDPFVLTAGGRAYFRVEDLIRVQDRLNQWKGCASPPESRVKETMPHVLRK